MVTIFPPLGPGIDQNLSSRRLLRDEPIHHGRLHRLGDFPKIRQDDGAVMFVKRGQVSRRADFEIVRFIPHPFELGLEVAADKGLHRPVDLILRPLGEVAVECTDAPGHGADQFVDCIPAGVEPRLIRFADTRVSS